MAIENCQQLYGSEPKIQVRPNGMWPIATTGEVKKEILPIVRIPLCPAIVRVNRSEFPKGVILLNDSPIPNNSAPYDFRYIVSADNYIDVPLTNNAGWPWCDKVVLWK